LASTTSYMPGNSILHRLDPRVKLIILVFLTIEVFFIKTFVALGVMFFSILFLWAIAKMSPRMIIKYLKMMMVLFIILIIMQAIFYPGATKLVDPLIPEASPILGGMGDITLEGIVFGVLLCWRVLTLICMLPLLLVTTTVEELALAMVKMGLPYKIAFTTTTALNQLPLLQTEVVQIMNAQKLRGFTVFENGKILQKFKAFPTLVVPFVMGAMRRANMMGVAMDSRAFGTSSTRTYITSIRMHSKDWVISALCMIYIVCLFLLNHYFLGKGIL
jgi:energy-coupling factor transport system permease protein